MASATLAQSAFGQSAAGQASAEPPVGALISGRMVQGTRVFSPGHDELGHIDDVMIDAVTGRVAYGVLQFGGFLGIGSDYHPIPFGRLKYDATLQGYITDLTKDDLEGAPSHQEDWRTDRDWQTRSHDYYGVMPYWV